MTSQTPSPPSDLVAWIQSFLDDLRPGQFLLIEYLSEQDLPVEPYAQAAIDPGGWYCEVVSDNYLPTHRWMLDEVTLRRQGWRAPESSTANWSLADVSHDDAAALLVGALWNGRGCRDSDLYSVSIGTFPPGPDGGEEIPEDLGLTLAA